MTLVVDAAAVVDLLLGRPAAAAIGRVLEADVDDLHAPGLLDLEVLSALRRPTLGGELTDQRAREAVDDLAGLPILRHGHVALLPRVWQLRANVDTVRRRLRRARGRTGRRCGPPHAGPASCTSGHRPYGGPHGPPRSFGRRSGPVGVERSVTRPFLH